MLWAKQQKIQFSFTLLYLGNDLVFIFLQSELSRPEKNSELFSKDAQLESRWVRGPF